MRIHYNRTANPEFAELTTTIDVNNPDSRWVAILRGLRSGDTISLIPKAHYAGWVNIVFRATIRIEYQPAVAREEVPRQTPSASVYEKLQHGDQQIRVLVVQPGGYDDEIRAGFEFTNLACPESEIRKFHALSYYWGDNPEHVPIKLGLDTGSLLPFSISPTVERAIRRLRGPNLPLRIWIDAVCINQSDHDERSQQVSMMGTIYSRADLVHVWLDENSGLEAALLVVRDFFNLHHRVCSGGNRCDCLGTKHTLSEDELASVRATPNHSFEFVWEVFDKHFRERQPSEAALDAAGGRGHINISVLMQTLFNHPWFQRVWVVQEAVLPRKTIIRLGKEAIDWEELIFINEVLEQRGYRIQVPNLRGEQTMPDIWRILGGPKVHKAGQLSILVVFLAALDLKATDPRDKLFALLAFGKETCQSDRIPPLLRPDYIKPVKNVMADFCRWWIRENKSLDILSCIHCHPPRAWQRILWDRNPTVESEMPVHKPTWTLGIEGYSRWCGVTLHAKFSFNACPNTTPDDELLETNASPLELRLRGHKVAELLALDHPPKALVSTTADGKKTEIQSVFDHLFDPCGTSGVWAHPKTSNVKSENTQISAARWVSNFRGHANAHEVFFDVPQPEQYALFPKEDGSYERRRQNGFITCIDRCFFVTSGGMYGLCPWTAREGDIIAVLDGGRVPFILRPVPCEGGDVSETQKYALVGECFVEGIMRGELGDRDMSDSEVFTLV
ncbi:hypothetical protein OQA88_4156 [Cercophora sp. LCS_1]